MRKPTLIVACIQLLLVIAAVNSVPINSDPRDEDLVKIAIKEIIQDDQVKQDFCNPNHIDRDGSQSVDRNFDPKTGKMTYTVDLGVIFHDQADCSENGDDDVNAQCVVVIRVGEDEENKIDVTCNVNEATQNEADESGDSNVTTTTAATSTASPPEGGNSNATPNEAEEHEDSKGQLVGGFGDATDLDPDFAQQLVNKASNAIDESAEVHLMFCNPGQIDYVQTVNITQQVVAGTNFNVILDLDFSKPTTECDYETKSVRCEVVIFRDFDQSLNVTSVDCNEKDASLNDGNENAGTSGSNTAGSGSQNENHEQEGNDDPTDDDLVKIAIKEIIQDDQVKEHFCNPNHIDQVGTPFVVRNLDSETYEMTYTVDLGVIFHDQADCSENGDDDVNAQCVVVINGNEKSVNCQKL